MDTYIPRFGTLKGTLFLIGLLLALGFGLALASPAHGETLHQTTKGDINGSVTVNGQGAAGIAVELHQRTNSGEDKLLASSKSDATGTYHFSDQPSAPNDAFYYVRFTGGKGMLTSWYSFPIIYINGTEVTVPAVEMADVELSAPTQNAGLALPGTLRWKARKMGETYRVFVYSTEKSDKPVLDSGSVGTGTEYLVAENALAAGKYEAIVQVRDALAGYGQSEARFHFTVGAGAAADAGSAEGAKNEQQAAPAAPTQAQASAPAQQGQAGQNNEGSDQTKEAQQEKPAAQSAPEIKVTLSADKTGVAPGDSIVYKLEVENAGGTAASGVVVTDKLPAGVSVSQARIKSEGQVSVNEGAVTVNVGSIAPGAKSTIEIPVNVKPDAGSNVSNQASVAYAGAREAVQSNAYIAQVTAPLAGPPEAGKEASAAQSSGGVSTIEQSSSAAASAAPAGSSGSSAPSAAPNGTSNSTANATSNAAGPSVSTQQAPASSQAGSQAAGQSSSQAASQAGSQAGAGAGAGAGVGASAPSAESGAATSVEKKASAPVPQTGGSFPIALAFTLVLVTLLARYLRGFTYRRA